MKESHPIEVAEYAVVNKIVEEPAFAWWAKKVLCKRDHIIWKVKARYWQRTHKYGILVPKTVDEARQGNGDNFLSRGNQKGDESHQACL
jgi:hypothetical protein